MKLVCSSDHTALDSRVGAQGVCHVRRSRLCRGLRNDAPRPWRTEYPAHARFDPNPECSEANAFRPWKRAKTLLPLGRAKRRPAFERTRPHSRIAELLPRGWKAARTQSAAAPATTLPA